MRACVCAKEKCCYFFSSAFLLNEIIKQNRNKLINVSIKQSTIYTKIELKSTGEKKLQQVIAFDVEVKAFFLLLNFNCTKTHQLVNIVHSTHPIDQIDDAHSCSVFMQHTLSIIAQLIRNFFIVVWLIRSETALYSI